MSKNKTKSFEEVIEEARRKYLLEEDVVRSNTTDREEEELERVDKELTREKIKHKRDTLNKYRRGEVSED